MKQKNMAYGIIMGLLVFLPLAISTKNYGLLGAGVGVGIAIGSAMENKEKPTKENKNKLLILVALGLISMLVVLGVIFFFLK